MYKIDLETVKKLIDLNNWLNQLEVKGIQNLNFLTNSIIVVQQILKILEEQDNKSITIDNSKEGK